MLLKDKTALITGATRGIGKAIAMKFASEGCNIAFTGRGTTPEQLANIEKVQNEISALGVKCVGYAADASDFEGTEKLIAKIKEDLGGIEVLVNNAGITRDTLLLRMSETQWDEVISNNLKSAFNYTHAVLPIMMRQKYGSIINISSVVGLHGNVGQANYAASKAALVALAKSIAQEMGAKGIRANAIAPGFIETDMTSAVPEEKRKEWAQNIPLRRAGQAQDVANAALFLASEMSSYISGQVIQVDGGMSM